MKKYLALIGILLIFACQQPKFGFVDNVELMDAYQEKIDVEARYKAKVEALNQKRDSISQAFQLEAQEFQNRAERMSSTNAQKEYDLLQQRGQFMAQQLQMEEQQLQQLGQTEMDSVVDRVKGEIEAYGKANNYNYIFGGGEGGSVLYGQEADDLTATLIAILNDKYKQ